MFSMTGYGRAMTERDGRQLTIELKSVNHRYRDISFRMPRSFAFVEDDMRRQIGQVIARGHLDVFATYRNLREDSVTMKVDHAVLRAFMGALDEIESATGLKNDLTLTAAAQMKDVLVVMEAEEDAEALRALVEETLDTALQRLMGMRAKEGAQLEHDLLSYVAKIELIASKIRDRYPATVEDYKNRLRAAVEELVGNHVDEQRLAQEVAIMADRSAIDEEVARLTSHIAQAREMIAMHEPVGRKLDFLVQEINREVNTISSKSQDIPITRLAVDAKAEIEKLREQVQNIE